jgi:RES domain-containing protein
VSLTAWRIVKRKYAKTAFSGEGAKQFGGRWNHPGVAIVYTAGSQSLAALEMLVHLDSAIALEGYVFFEVTIDESLVKKIEKSRLPRSWRADPPPDENQQIGDEWVRDGSSAVLEVPSVVIPDEPNYLLNPQHADFPKLKIGKPAPFQFDRRLAAR